jgi:hypothetical protein
MIAHADDAVADRLNGANDGRQEIARQRDREKRRDAEPDDETEKVRARPVGDQRDQGSGHERKTDREERQLAFEGIAHPARIAVCGTAYPRDSNGSTRDRAVKAVPSVPAFPSGGTAPGGSIRARVRPAR